MAFDLGDYKDVNERLADLKAKYPEASIRSEIVGLPDGFAGQFLAVRATVYRSPDDPAPATGMAWEPVPGQTPYTKNSELQNAETSAWGRAIIAALASESKQIASRQEVEPRQAERAIRQEPAFNAKEWLKLSTKAFKDWTDDDRRDAAKNAVAATTPGKPMSKDEAQAVFDHMAAAYYLEHPGDEQGLF